MKSLKNFHEHLKNKSDVSKNLFFILAIVLIIPATTMAQSQMVTGMGIKAGLNYNANGNYFESVSTNADNPDRNIGYHIGLFGKIGNSRLYFKPELVYTATKSDYTSNDFKMKKMDAPLLVGTRIFGPISVFGGPSLQYILDSKFGGISINNIKNDFSVGLNFGVAFNLKKIGIDVRYERGFSKNEATFLNNNNVDITSRLDTRPNQLILSLSAVL